jgi:Uncharacterized protein conserved in bacteria (DUF2255)
MGRLLFGLLLVLMLVAGGTYWAGEQTEVAVLRTTDAEGVSYDTELWVVDYEDDPWVRVANPERSWYERLRENPDVELVRDGETRRYRAEPHDVPEIAAELDEAFRAKYGLVDWWYGLLLRRQPIPVRLAPVLP